MKNQIDRFLKGKGIYVCRACNKATRETGQEESDVELCKVCYLEGLEENRIADGGK